MGLRSIELLTNGEYIAILGFKLEWPTNPWQPLCPAFNGRPLRVLAVSPPFVAVQDIQANRYALDFRAYELTKLDRAYAEVFPWVRGVQVQQPVEFWEKTTEPGRPIHLTNNPIYEQMGEEVKQRSDTEVVQCPRCGARMTLHFYERPQSGWRRVCKVCGLDAGPVDGDNPPQEQGAKE